MAPFLILLLFLSGAASDRTVVPVHPGDDAILPCQAADSSISVVKWSRADLKPDIVLLNIDGRLKTADQHSSFKDRVELVYRDLKDRDVSLTLKNVSSIDTGTYTCGVKTSDTDPIRTITTIHLQVTERGSGDVPSSPVGLIVGLAASVLILVAVAVVGVLMYKRHVIKVTGIPGDDVILPCWAAGSSIRAVEWNRPDLKPDTVLLYRDGDFNTSDQHPSFKDRVKLRDRDMKDGDVSLTLKNVDIDDAGTYVCRVKTDGIYPGRTISIIHLQVPDLNEVITVHPGDDAILPCQAAGSSISVVKWSRADLKPDTVLLYRDGDFNTSDQNPSFKDRVELEDRDMKDGDVSLILKTVDIDDAGIYKCQVKSSGSNPIRLIRTVRLQVPVPPGKDVIIPCRADYCNIRAVKWTRADLEPDIVLSYSNGNLDPTYQHPSFKDRVELVDRDLKDRDLSFILKNATMNDNGTYVCRVQIGNGVKFTTIRTIRLQVRELAVLRMETPLL